MHAKFALPLVLAVLTTTGCSTTQSRPLRQLPKFTSLELDEAPGPSTQQAPVTTKRAQPSTHVFLKVGTRSLDDDTFWSEVDRPLAFGVEVDYRDPGSILGAEFGIGFAIDAEDRALIDTVGSFIEAYGGLRLTGDMGPGKRIHPYIGAGAVVMFAYEEHFTGVVDVDDDDTTFGGYAHVGAYYSISRHIHIGVDGRIVFGTDLDMFGISTDADYKQLSFMVGTGF